jgi:PUA domain protein
MFRKFSKEDNVKTISPARSSEQRAIRTAVVQQYPALEPFIDDIFPKKESLNVCKCKDYIQILLGPSNEPIFFQCRSGPYIPTLRFLHRYPDILPKYQVDRGAIRFVLSGANIMSPGLTSKGGHMADVPAESVVAIMAEDKEHAMAIGITTMSTETILKENNGIAVENTHWLKDGLWGMTKIE